MIVLGIETSCDETAVAVVEHGRRVRANIIQSQIPIHQPFGGVVPEIAARQHMENLSQIMRKALCVAGITLADATAVAVANGPGLAGALLSGLAFAKGLVLARPQTALVGVHHLYGHICANFLEEEHFAPPFVALIVSGGHTLLVAVDSYRVCRVLGGTRDDAAGEAYDKVGRVLGLPYPGGPNLEKLARHGDPAAIPFPRTRFVHEPFAFSFSGLKSAVLNYLQKNPGLSETHKADVAASFQQAVLDVLVGHTTAACAETGFSRVALGGGVASNGALRTAMAEACRANGLHLNIPAPEYCTDNAAMIASGGFFRLQNGERDELDLDAYPAFGGMGF